LVNQLPAISLTSFPANVTYDITITNVHPSAPSVILDAEDALLESFGYSFGETLPFEVAVGGAVHETFAMTIATREECLRLASLDGMQDTVIDNVYRVRWDTGATLCSARITCGAPPPNGGATRTMGFFKTHIMAMQQCVDDGPINLGYVTIDSLEDALGMLWGNPSRFEDGALRNTLDAARFRLARQTLVGICNQRLFGTSPTPSDLLTDAVAALAGTDCSDISELISDVDAFNNQGDAIPFPVGFIPGPATPQVARTISDDPTSPSGQVCSP
jgi:hypothetical protein